MIVALSDCCTVPIHVRALELEPAVRLPGGTDRLFLSDDGPAEIKFVLNEVMVQNV